MKLFGLSVTKAKAPENLRPVASSWGGGWWPTIRESFTGAWQRNIEINHDSVVSFSAVFSCVTLIASDIGKLCLRLTSVNPDLTSTPAYSPSFSPVLAKPNRFQTWNKFIEQWIVSKLLHGNTYVLKERDGRGVVVAMYVLHALRVIPLVAPDGSVYYQLKTDHLSGIPVDDVVVPASEIIHDTMVCLFHPLVGISPIYACGLAATQGIRIQENSARFFGNNSTPGGVLTAPTAISDETAARLKTHWDANYSGMNAGKVAVLGDGLKYEAMAVTATDAQLIEQLKWTAETVCSCFHVPGYKIGVGATPTYANAQVLNQIYYSDCIQSLLENLEALLKDGLALPAPYAVEFDLDGLLRMDTLTLVSTVKDAVGAGIMAPNEARAKLNLAPVAGGDTPYLQVQNYSLSALDKRDQGNPLATPVPTKPTLPAPDEPEPDEAAAQEARDFLEIIQKGLTHAS
jgi:HK97 family phage portal protein